MIPDKLRPISAAENITVRQAMDLISNAVLAGAPTGMVLIVDDDDRLVGLVTDGDIRRGLLRGQHLDDPVRDLMITDPVVLSASLTPEEMLQQVTDEASQRSRLKENKVEKLILVDDDRHVVDIVTFYELWHLTQATSRTVAVVGMGFVGLTLAAVMADVGFQVVGVESRADVVAGLRRGQAHFHETGLIPLLRHHGRQERLTFVEDVSDAVADTFIICVGTPVDDAGTPLLDDVRAATEAVGKVLPKRGLVLLRSTVPVGTCRDVVVPILEETSGMKAGRDFFVAFAPERTVEGKALEELRKLPQIVGGLDSASTRMAADLMRKVTPTIVEVESLEAAEMIKLVNNSFRDLSFAFANQVALVCSKWNLDANELIQSANEGYPRNPVPTPSPGVGGICLRKDPYIFDSVAQKAGLSNSLPAQGRAVNRFMPEYVAETFLRFLKEHGKDPATAKVFLAGLAFKGYPETSDMRNSPALDLAEILRRAGVQPRGYDPVVSPADIESEGIHACSLEDGFKDADIAAILNNHLSFPRIDVFSLLDLTKKPALFYDGWHVFHADEIARIPGITYGSLGVLRPEQRNREG